MVNPNFRYTVSGLDGWSVDFSGGSNPDGTGVFNLGFPAAANAVDLCNTGNYPSRSPIGWGLWPLVSPIGQALPTSNTRSAGNSNGDSNAANKLIYPFVGSIITLPTPANPSRYGGADGKQDLRPGIKPSTFSFSGGDITITVTSGFPTTASTAPVVQTLNLHFPALNSLPVPSYARASTNDDVADGNVNSTNSSNPLYNHPTVTDQTKLEFYTQMRFDIGSFPLRIGNLITGWDSTTSSQTNWYNYEALIQRGDTVRSLVPNPNSQIHGDLRIIANLPVVPVNLTGDAQPLYTLLGTNQTKDCNGTILYPANAVNSSDYAQFHSLCLDSGNFEVWLLRVNTAPISTSYDTPPVSWTNWGGAGNSGGQGKAGGTLFSSLVYANACTPNVTPELQGTFMDSANSIPGDWSNGYGSLSDGPMVVGSDEGFQNARATGYSSPYYETSGGGVAGGTNALVSESFSPNRQIASPVMFGTLPAGVQAGQGWRTLLFCPNPSAGSSHPGFGVGTGTQGPTAYAPYTTPPDHLLLDLFWMPIVEPYAISEPFATAGKINMNYQIVPFSYIHRSTGVRAVLKSIRLLALPNTASQKQGGGGAQYKETSLHQANIGAAQNANYRYNINLDETIDASDSGFQQRFVTQNDIFRSASEICNIFLVPQAIPGNTYTGKGLTVPTSYSTTAAWWNDFQLTGDNNRESPYNQIYPRLTTKSNSFQVHFRVQTLVKSSATDPTVFDSTQGDSIGGEYRGSSIIERYIDPNDTTLPDFAAGANSFTTAGTTLDSYYHYRVVRSKSFTP
jgi:uncharacterized protein (TIGR02600 family)